MLEVKSKVTQTGLSVQFKNQFYPIQYPTGYWEKTPMATRKALTENLALATTMHLPLVFNDPQILYHSTKPLFEPYFFDNFIRDIPSCAEVDNTDTAELVRRFFSVRYMFTNHEVTVPSPEQVQDGHRAIIGFSFGKDSLLTYAVADEIGLNPETGYLVEDSMTYEKKHKMALAVRFRKEFGKSLHILRHDTGKLRNYKHLGLPFTELGWGLQSTEYAIELIPLAYALQGKYILFGNEQATSETHLNNIDKWFIYACYDQSHTWTCHLNQITQVLSGRSVTTGSLIEPLMDMMVQWVLAHRYPKIAKYQMSCFTETDAGRDYRWCHNCTSCATMYLLCSASGIDPASIGMRHSMFQREKKRNFVIFDKKYTIPFSYTDATRDEQLFTFYSATKRGIKGDLIDEFKESDLYDEAREREDELFKKFVHIYDSITIPSELKEQVMSIYREEIAFFEV